MDSSKKDENQDKSKKALLIEDDLVCQKIMTYYLRQLDYHVDVSDDYYQAVKTISCNVYDLIIGDINLHGELLGQGIAEAAHESELNRATPIILWSAYINSNDEEKYLNGDVDAALMKTCNIQDLKKAIRKCFLTPRYEKEFRHRLKMLKQRWQQHGGSIELLHALFDLRHLPLSILVDVLNSIIQYQRWRSLHSNEKHAS